MNLPNKLSIVRIILIPVFVVLFFLPFRLTGIFALSVFIIASLTDMLDGYIARKYNMITKVGNFLDTIADKMLVVCVLVCVSVMAFVTTAEISNRVFANVILYSIIGSTMIIVCRELFISGLKMIAQTKGITVSADKLGKIKMTVQIVALAVLIPCASIFTINQMAGQIVLYIGSALLFIATLITIISAINYILKYRHVFSEEETSIEVAQSHTETDKKENSEKSDMEITVEIDIELADKDTKEDPVS